MILLCCGKTWAGFEQKNAMLRLLWKRNPHAGERGTDRRLAGKQVRGRSRGELDAS